MKITSKNLTIVSLICYFIASAIIVVNLGWWVLLGLFLWTVANRIEFTHEILKIIKRLLLEPDTIINDDVPVED